MEFCQWAKADLVNSHFRAVVSKAVEEGYRNLRECPKHQVGHVLIIDAANLPTRILRKFIVNPSARTELLAEMLLTPSSNLSDVKKTAANLLRCNTVLAFVDKGNEAGLPEKFEYPESTFEYEAYQRGYSSNYFYTKILRNYAISGYIRIIERNFNTVIKHKDLTPDKINQTIFEDCLGTQEFIEWLFTIISRVAPRPLENALDDILKDLTSIQKISDQVLGPNWSEGVMDDDERSEIKEVPRHEDLRELGNPFTRLDTKTEILNAFPSLNATSSSSASESFLRSLSIVDKIGKRRFSSNAHRIQFAPWYSKAVEELWDVLDRKIGIMNSHYPGTSEDVLAAIGVSDGLKAGLTALLRHSPTLDDPDNQRVLRAIRASRTIDLLRDAARWLGRGASYWLRTLQPREEVPTEPPLRVLIIDNTILETGTRRDSMTAALLNSIFQALDPDGKRIEVDIFESNFGLRMNKEDIDKYLTYSVQDRDRFFDEKVNVFKRFYPKTGEVIYKDLLEYDIILMEIDYADAYVGPRVIQWLNLYIDRRIEGKLQRTPAINKTPKVPAGPAVLALTRDDKLGNVHQSMNLGAMSYVAKDRLLQLPSRMKRAMVGRGNRIERAGGRSNFRMLYHIMPDDRAHLTSEANLIRGQPLWKREECESQVLKRYFPVREERWIRSLPKADLHCHLGTSVRLTTIIGLAINTVGYLVKSAKLKEDSPLKTLGLTISQIVKMADENIRGDKDATPEARILQIKHLANAAIKSLPGALRQGIKQDYGIGDSLVASLKHPADPLQEFEIMALLVVAIAICETTGRSKTPAERQANLLQSCLGDALNYLRDLDRMATEEESFKSKRFLDRVQYTFSLICGGGWNGLFTEHEIAANVSARPSKFWCDLADRIEDRFNEAFSFVHSYFEDYQSDSESGISFEKIVRIADIRTAEGQKADRSLLAYLRGCDFVGSCHFQYPENLIIAAKDFVRTNAEHGVIYAEVRAEVTGYNKAGMDPKDVTDLLCRAFDLAAAWIKPKKVDMGAGEKAAPFVRVNLLIAAKRHKDKDKAREAIELSKHFLTRPPQTFSDPDWVPVWWQPARVVGFDLSGNEGVEAREIKEMMVDLKRISAPITIHAGEALDAQSIWDAVYAWAALRIGHGLRLREEKQLLDYCVNEDICMEMCPVSNTFTSCFGEPDDRKSYAPDNRFHYPLRHYLMEGLPVCINTDNRELHPKELQGLTAEYLMAARLSGGLTQWEILKLVKTGFRHAFLSKAETALFLESVEDRVFNLLRG